MTTAVFGKARDGGPRRGCMRNAELCSVADRGRRGEQVNDGGNWFGSGRRTEGGGGWQGGAHGGRDAVRDAREAIGPGQGAQEEVGC